MSAGAEFWHSVAEVLDEAGRVTEREVKVTVSRAKAREWMAEAATCARRRAEWLGGSSSVSMLESNDEERIMLRGGLPVGVFFVAACRAPLVQGEPEGLNCKGGCLFSGVG